MKKPMSYKKRVVVVGGGFAGLNFARQLFKNKFYQVTLVDKHNYNYFTPLLYQVATGFLEPSAISYPFRKLFLRWCSFINWISQTTIIYKDLPISRYQPKLQGFLGLWLSPDNNRKSAFFAK